MKRMLISFIYVRAIILPVITQEVESARNINYKGKQTVQRRPFPKGADRRPDPAEHPGQLSLRIAGKGNIFGNKILSGDPSMIRNGGRS